MRQIASIQVLRAVAALAVTVAHSSIEATFLGGSMPFWSRYGAAGVDLFFVISGFIMVHTSDHLFGQPGGAAMFAARRLIRIVPLYWLATSVVLLQLAHLGEPMPGCIVASYLFVPCDGGARGFMPVLGPGWTLNYEMFFYALFAVAVMLPRRQAVLAVIASLVAFTATRGLWPLPALNWWAARPIGADLHGVVLEFAFGAGIALAYREGFTLPRWAALGLIAAGVAAFLVASGYALHEWSLPFFWGLPCAAIVAGCVFLGDPAKPGPVWRWLVVLGGASYALYLTHGIVQLAARTDFAGVSRAVAGVSPWLYTGALSALCVVVALVVFAVIERPMTDALRSRLRNDALLGRLERAV